MRWADNGGGDFQAAPVGTHPARCIRVLDLGTQRGEYQGQATIRRQVIVAWELPTELMEDGNNAGKPFIVSKFYTASLSEKANLRKDLENWRGRTFTAAELEGFESRNILEKPCLVTVIHNQKGKARVSGVTALPKGFQIPSQVNPTVYFSLDEFDQKTFDALSDGIKKIIMGSPEYQQLKNPNHGPSDDGWEPGDPPADVDDSAPF